MPQTLFQEVERCLMEAEAPSKTLQAYLEAGKFAVFPFDRLLEQQRTEQSPIHHPEGNVWNHTLLVVDQAARRKAQSTNARAFMWAALLHDIGKPAATKIRRGKITAYDHDKIGAVLAKEFLSALTADTALIEQVAALVRYHMQLLFVLKDLPFQDIEGMKASVSIRDVALLGLCDRLGRTGAQEIDEEENAARFLEKCAHFP